MSKIISKTLFINVEDTIKVGNNDAIEVTVVQNLIAFEKKDGGVGVDVDYIDVKNVKFLGIPIKEGYNEYKKFKLQLSELGIDVDELIEEKIKNLVDEETINKTKRMFLKINPYNKFKGPGVNNFC